MDIKRQAAIYQNQGLRAALFIGCAEIELDIAHASEEKTQMLVEQRAKLLDELGLDERPYCDPQ